MNAQTTPSTSRPADSRPAFTRPLELPCTGQALREALRHNDTSALTQIVLQLRVAGYQVDGASLATQLLTHGCIWVRDAFGQRVALQVHVPGAEAQRAPDESCDFRIAA